jgi:signal transduction histidine kinase
VAVVAATLPFAPGLGPSEGVTLCVATLGWVAALLLIDAISARSPGFPASAARSFVGVVAVVAVMVAIPRVAVPGALLLLVGVGFYTWAGGLSLGLWLSAAVVGGALLAQVLAPAEHQADERWLLAYAIAAPVLVVIVDRLTSGHRRTTEALAHLHDSLDEVAAQPDLAATLQSIADSIAEGVEARVAGVLVLDGDEFTVVTRTVTPLDLTSQQIDRFTRAEIELGTEGPLGVALADQEPVVVSDLDGDPVFPGWFQPWTETLRRLGCRSLVLVPLRADGRSFGVLAAALPWLGGLEGKDLSFLREFAARASTVIVRARVYEEERAAATELAEIDRQKSEFLALVSNELRTPLTAVKGCVDTVLGDWEQLDDDGRRELLERASTDADELTRLVGQLLDYARTDAGVVEMVPQPLGIRPAVEFALEDLASVVADHRVVLDIPARIAVLADPTGFDHVIKNLLTNAAQFSPPGSQVVVEAKPAGDEIVISVRDDGPGIADPDDQRGFDRYYQSSDALRRASGGIGLTIARRFTEMHGGRIWVEKERGRGSTYSFSLPAAHLAPNGVGS